MIISPFRSKIVGGGGLVPFIFPPAEAPDGLVLTVLGGTSIKLDWDDNSLTEDGFSIGRSPDNATWVEIDTVLADVETYTDTTCATGTLYYYRVAAYKGAVYSAYTASASATTWSAGEVAICAGNTSAWYDNDNIYKELLGGSSVEVWLDRANYAEGIELINQATWYNSAYWTATGFGAAWSTVGSTIHCDGTSVNTSIGITGFLAANKVYLINLSVIVIAGTIRIEDGAIDISYTTSGTKTVYFASNTAPMPLYITSLSGEFTITSLSVKEVSGNWLRQRTVASRPSNSVNGVLFDGSNDFLKTIAFTLNQPYSVYAVLKQVTWSAGDCLMDGNTDYLMYFIQNDATPGLKLYLGTGYSAENANLALDTWGIIRIQANGANSKFQIDATAALTGSWGADNAGGFTLGKMGSSAWYANIQVKEIVIRNIVDGAPDEAAIYAYLKTKYGL